MMAFWTGLVVLGFVVTVLIAESRPVRRRLERRSGGSDAGRASFWSGWGGDGGGGSIVGAWAGAHYGRKLPEVWLRRIVIVGGTIVAVILIFD